MKDEIDIRIYRRLDEMKILIDDDRDYYNNGRYQWILTKHSSNQYVESIKTGLHLFLRGL